MIAKFSSPLADVDPDSDYFHELFTSVDGAIQSDYYTIGNFNSKFSKSSADFYNECQYTYCVVLVRTLITN